jgi:signal transduction histidine kinase
MHDTNRGGLNPPSNEDDLRQEERRRERTRIVHELHDTLLQGFLGASMLLDQAVEQTPVDSPSKPALNRALCLVRRAIERAARLCGGFKLSHLRDRASSRPFRTFSAKSQSSGVHGFEPWSREVRGR